jgi:hypothetical protein
LVFGAEFTGLGYVLGLGTPTTSMAVLHATGPGSCFPQPVWDITNENPGPAGAATYFLGGGLTARRELYYSGVRHWYCASEHGWRR